MPHSLEDDSGVKIPGLADVTHDLFPQGVSGQKHRQRRRERNHVFANVSPALLPLASFLHGGVVTGLVHTAWAPSTAVKKELISLHSQAPGGAVMSTPRSRLTRAIFTYSSTKSAGKTHPLQGEFRCPIPASRSSLLTLHTFPITVRLKKKTTNQEKDGTWNLAATIL